MGGDVELEGRGRGRGVGSSFVLDLWLGVGMVCGPWAHCFPSCLWVYTPWHFFQSFPRACFSISPRIQGTGFMSPFCMR